MATSIDTQRDEITRVLGSLADHQPADSIVEMVLQRIHARRADGEYPQRMSRAMFGIYAIHAVKTMAQERTVWQDYQTGDLLDLTPWLDTRVPRDLGDPARMFA